MLLKLGVSIEFLRREMRRGLNIIDEVFKAAGEEAAVTSTRDGVHKAGSLHYADLAVDLRTPRRVVVEDLRAKLGPEFDVVVEKDHWHVEHDPRI